jgi:hypothetical protein
MYACIFLLVTASQVERVISSEERSILLAENQTGMNVSHLVFSLL